MLDAGAGIAGGVETAAGAAEGGGGPARDAGMLALCCEAQPTRASSRGATRRSMGAATRPRKPHGGPTCKTVQRCARLERPSVLFRGRGAGRVSGSSRRPPPVAPAAWGDRGVRVACGHRGARDFTDRRLHDCHSSVSVTESPAYRVGGPSAIWIGSFLVGERAFSFTTCRMGISNVPVVRPPRSLSPKTSLWESIPALFRRRSRPMFRDSRPMNRAPRSWFRDSRPWFRHRASSNSNPGSGDCKGDVLLPKGAPGFAKAPFRFERARPGITRASLTIARGAFAVARASVAIARAKDGSSRATGRFGTVAFERAERESRNQEAPAQSSERRPGRKWRSWFRQRRPWFRERRSWFPDRPSHTT